jgi:hypothetical protein
MAAPLTSGQSSLLLWLLSLLVYLLGTHVGMAALREVLRDDLSDGTPSPRHSPISAQDRVRLALTAGAAWGSALTVGFVLALASMPLPYAVGFQATAGILLWTAAVVLCFGLALAVLRMPLWPGPPLAGVALGLLALLLQAGWLGAAGFKPGLAWRLETLMLAGAVMSLGLALALTMGFSEATRTSPWRRRWRAGAAVLATLALLAGQELLLGGMQLVKQLGSLHQHQLSSALLSLIGGAGLPIALVITMLTLHFGRRSRSRRHHRDFTLTQLVEARPQSWPRQRKRVRTGIKFTGSPGSRRSGSGSVQSRK